MKKLILEHFQKYRSHSEAAVLSGFGFVFAQSRAAGGMLLRSASPKRQNSSLPNGYIIFSNALMRKIVIALAAGFLAVTAQAQFRIISVGDGIYTRFGGQMNPTGKSDSFSPTNVPSVTCVLNSRSFSGSMVPTFGGPMTQMYGYEYQVTLNNNGATDANTVTINSLTLPFGVPEFFSFGMRGLNQVWVLNPAGPPDFAPVSADMDGTNVVLHFDPPLTLSTPNEQTTNTFYFGMMSTNAPEITTAILSGTAQDPAQGSLPFKAKVKAQTP